MKTIYIGVIGVGVMGERHCRVCANLPRVELVGITDLKQERGRQVADCYDTLFSRTAMPCWLRWKLSSSPHLRPCTIA